MMDPRLHKVILPRVDGRGGNQEVRRFNNLRIQRSVDDVLAGLPDHSAILDVEIVSDDGEKTVEAVLAAKLGGHWSVAMFGGYRDPKDWVGGVRVAKSWGDD